VEISWRLVLISPVFWQGKWLQQKRGVQTKTLEEERDFYKRGFEESQQEIRQLKALSQNLHSENQELMSYCYRLPTVSTFLCIPCALQTCRKEYEDV